MYVSAESGGGSAMVVNRTTASNWETFRLWRINQSSFNFRVNNDNFMGLTGSSDGKRVFSRATLPGFNETFVIERQNNSLRLRIRAPNGLYLQAINGDSLRADYGGNVSDWSDRNPWVFVMTIVSKLGGEYQLTNGYGPDRAPAVMRSHWNSYIGVDDFKFMSQNGINAVRIPVGWWIMFDPNPPNPFVGGSLQALDNAFLWAQQYKIKVIVTLHAANGSQNGFDHSATRDGSLLWGASYIPQTVAVIDFLTKRYANRSSLCAIELLNEPLAPGVSLGDLTNYYRQGYAAVRKYTSTAYVILSSRVGSTNNTELLSFANGLPRSVLDVHYYNLFSSSFQNLTVQQNIDYIYNERAKTLKEITPTNGTLSFVGEWVAEWLVRNASVQDYQRYAKAQLDVYSNATFGWGYWSYNCTFPQWSLKWMIQNNIIKLQ